MTGQRPPPPNFRRAFAQSARQANVPVEDADRAMILGQIASFLVADARIGEQIAFKDGAIMRLVDDSPRLSKDLDSVVVTGRSIKRQWVDEALGTEPARQVVLGIDKNGGATRSSLVIPIIHCRSLSGRGKVTVSVSFNWSEPLQITPEWRTIVLPHDRRVDIPVLAAPERAAEKVRAFLTPERPALYNDAFDLYQYASRVLPATAWPQLATLVLVKLSSPSYHVLAGTDLHALFESQHTLVEQGWGRASRVIAVEPLPTWDEVGPHVRRFKEIVPALRP